MDGNTPTSKYGGVAQLGEHLLCKQGVIGSNPFISTSPADEAMAEAGNTRGRVGNHLSNQEMGL